MPAPHVHVAPPAQPPAASLEWLVWLCAIAAILVMVGVLAASRR
ncbi:MAG TPA: hypothetical protein VFA05_06560 [Gaiellaceae bacterium]|nr:hypothetical protein [Gaiellaceae bacterium]